MKKIIMLVIAATAVFTYVNAQKVCCPEFRLSASWEPCDTLPRIVQEHGTDPNGGSGQPPIGTTTSGPKDCELKACKNSTHKYFVYPIQTGFTYKWQVIGGTPNTLTGDPMDILWGSGNTGKITVFISNADSTCRDTVEKTVCLVNSPKASFTFSPAGPFCANSTVQFTNTSTGAVGYYWDFGDGSTSTLQNPSHTFTTGGTYNVVLTVTSYMGGGGSGSPTQGESYNCGCKDIITKVITVKNESGTSIIPGCKKMLCFGDTASYCAGSNCASYNWSVTGGHIIGSKNGSCINVVWDGSYPATVTLTGNCGGTCGNTATINVPVLYATVPVSGQNIVCRSSVTGYSLPVMPGTFYNWSISGGGMITGPDKNTAAITVQWGSAMGSYTITCNYENPSTHCKGTGTITVKIAPKYEVKGSEKFCVNDPFIFNATNTGTWSIAPNSGFTPLTFPVGSSISGVWHVPGTYNITAVSTTPANYCNSTAVISVVVLDTPKLNPIIGDLLICPGSTQIYSVSSNMNEPMFNWYPVQGGNVVSLMGNNHDSVVVQWDPAGPYSISVTQTVNGCSSSPKTFSPVVYPAPTFSGAIHACMDQEFIYTSPTPAPPGGYTWTLNNGGGTITNGQGTNSIKILWHGSANGTDSTNITLTTCSGTFTIKVYIATPTPGIITETGNLCILPGKTLTSTATGSTYLWTLNNIAMGPSYNTQSINVISAGMYAVTVTSTIGCSSKGYINIAMPVFPKATISTPDKVWWKCTETISTTFTALPNGAGYCYQWYKYGSGAVGTNSPIYTATQTGQYWCVVSLCNTLCFSNSDTVQIVKETCDGGPGQPCNPNYTFNATHDLCNPFHFNLTTTPAAAATTAHWYFGDGCVLPEAWGLSVTHKYDHVGNFKVCAIFGDWPYCRKDTCFIITVPLVAKFSPQINCKTVTPVNLSETITPGNTTYAWTFPGATPASSTAQNPPNITYAAPGTYTITLTVTNGTCTETYKETVLIDFPTAQMNIPAVVCALTDAPFLGTATGTGLSYHWDFGDTYTSNLQNVSHAYQLPGNYTVTFKVTDKNGCTAIDTRTITVLPAIAVSIGPNQLFCPGASATFTAGPGSFLTYQWYKDGVLISGATSSSYAATVMGEYWVVVTNGSGCVAQSNKAKAIYRPTPIARIKKKAVQCKTAGTLVFNMQNILDEAGCTYHWSCPGVSFSPNNTIGTSNTWATVTGIGDFEIVLEVTNSFGCKSKDTMCVSVVAGVTVTVTSPAGMLCAGNMHTFVANALPVLTLPSQYYYQWNTGVTGNILNTGNSGMNTVTVTNSYGCVGMASTPPVKKRVDVSLFPVGCDTLCLTDTAHFPLPLGGGLTPSSYTIQWFDSGTPVGTNSVDLPLAATGAGDHHFYAVVTLAGGCSDTTGTFDLFVKDCTLTKPCDDCPTILDKATFTSSSFVSGNILNGVVTFTNIKPLKEVHIRIADIAYHWNDTTCRNCKINISDRACLFPANAAQQVGTLVWDNFTAAPLPPSASATDCPKELIFKPGIVLQPGTYSIPVQIALASPKSSNCKLVIDKLCMHMLLKDEDCKVCEKNLCREDSVITKPTDSSKCGCSAGNNWTNLYLVPLRPGVPKPKTLIFCSSTITGYEANAAYTLSGMYNCRPGCVSVKNEVVIRNQVGDIIYTHVGATLYENISFPVRGVYIVTLTAWCGDKKCECVFKIDVTPGGKIPDEHTDPKDPKDPKNPEIPKPPVTTVLTADIDKIVTDILPPDFSGAVLVAQRDSILYEKYKGTRINNHTAFDLASVAKTFTAMAVLKMAEEKKVDLNDDVAKYLSNFPFTGITLKMLLSHRSGLEDYVKFLQAPDVDKNKMMSNDDLLQYIIENKNKVKIAPPGTVFDYSNTNFALLALIIEKVSGQKYPQYLADKFFKPLHMDDTYVFGPANAATATPSYYKGGKKYELKSMDYIFGDKNIYTTVKDMMKWDKALRDGKIFSKETISLAYTPGSTLIPYQSNYGLGWRILLVPNGKKMIYHNGWWHGMRSVFIRLADEEAVIIILSNSSFSTISNSRKLADLFGQYQQAEKSIVNF